MKPSAAESMKKLLEAEDNHINKLHQIVAETLKEEKLISQRLRREFREKPSFGDRIADRVASFGGSWKFIFSFFIFMAVWMALNLWPGVRDPLDPFPFVLLNLLLSCLAALQAPVILMSQNRLEAKDRKRAEHDYIVNLKAELEIRALHQKLDMLMMEQMTMMLEKQEKQLLVLEALKKHPPKTS